MMTVFLLISKLLMLRRHHFSRNTLRGRKPVETRKKMGVGYALFGYQGFVPTGLKNEMPSWSSAFPAPRVTGCVAGK